METSDRKKIAFTAVCGVAGATICAVLYYLLWRNNKLLSQSLTELRRMNSANQKATKVIADKFGSSVVVGDTVKYLAQRILSLATFGWL